ncbi:uncharacterized protein LOC111625128 [Centruroides sculpturatus]|uniref:uncharacterized protein LOC111625128 n=1 Tax=Centruroides sculpturatus TaxID=218467 RepID=UPI000C6D4EA9|nr:uncharacterized protein LOC111625128 [Centruroides sculpturatus]
MVVAKATKASNALISIARNTWGIGYNAAKNIYLGAIEPILLYASPIWADATSKVYIQRKLLKAQRVAALRICRAYRTAPTAALLVITGITPVHIKARMIHRNWNANNLFSNCHPLNNDKNKSILSDLPTHLKEDILSSGIELKDIQLNILQDYPFINSDSQSSNESDFSIYTDGSKDDINVGAAFVLYDHHNGNIHRSAYKLGPHCSVPQAEILAIVKALDHVYADWFPPNKTIAIYSDSITAIHSITNLKQRGANVLHIHHLLSINKHKHKHNISFNWVRGHSGVAGNEAADHLAKTAATSSLPSTYNRIPLSKIKQWSRQLALQEWQSEWDCGDTGRVTHNYIPNISRRLEWKHFTPSFVMTQLLTGHGNFNAYLNRFRLRESGVCHCDDTAIQDSNHYLLDCSLFDHQRNNLIGCVLYAGFNWPCSPDTLLENKDIYNSLKKFLTSTAALCPRRNPHTTDNDEPSASH